MQSLLFLLAIFAGLMNPLQSGMTSSLRRVWGTPLMAGLSSVAVTLLALLAFGTVARQFAWPGAARLAEAPWWAWLAGLCGAVFLVAQPVVAPRLGAGAFISVTVSASVIGSLVLDHFGWLGFAQHTAGLGRIAGAVLMVIGVVLVTLL